MKIVLYLLVLAFLVGCNSEISRTQDPVERANAAVNQSYLNGNSAIDTRKVETPAVPSLDLREFPNMFIENGTFTGMIVWGTNYKFEGSKDAGTRGPLAILVGTSILKGIEKGDPGPNQRIKLRMGTADKYILQGNFSQFNIIAIDHPCYNNVTAKLMNIEHKSCYDEAAKRVPSNAALIRLYYYEGKVHMVVISEDADMLAAAGTVLENYPQYPLSGIEVFVTKNSEGEIRISSG